MSSDGQQKSKKVTHEDAIRWVAANLRDEVGLDNEPSEKDAPSDEAWCMYQWASRDSDSMDKFWTGTWKAMAAKEKKQETKGMTDDQRTQFRILTNLRNMMPRPTNGTPASTSCFVPAVQAVPSA